jgi:hypothetical protein
MKYFYTIIFMLGIFHSNLKATHIVGGEIEIYPLRLNIYEIVLKLYGDNINGEDATQVELKNKPVVYIYEKGTNILKQSVQLGDEKKFRTFLVNYGPICSGTTATQKISTRYISYTGNILLDPQSYSHPAGYYISWENCCRNETIENILNPLNTGMAFYTEFPPLMKNGVRFINSSPTFKPIIGDYPCLGRPFTFDFSGTDQDSLVYSVITPLAGNITLNSIISSKPAPYPEVKWKAPYNVNNQIPGSPPFSVNSETGIISFTPNKVGLYVFSINVEEFRDKIKIGEVRRDFQLLVVNCPDNKPTSIQVELPDATVYNPSNDTLEINIAQDTCFTIVVGDQDANSKTENLTLKTIENTLPPSIISFSPAVSVGPSKQNDRSRICFDACNKLYIDKDTIFKIVMLVTDGPKCPLSLSTYDTITIFVKYTPQINQKPSIGIIPNIIFYDATVGRSIEFDVYGEDDDERDTLQLSAQGQGFNLGDIGMTFNTDPGTDSIGSKFSWTPSCEHLDGSPYEVKFIVDDNSCIKENSDTILVRFELKDTTTTLQDIRPINLITPNGDDQNEYFGLPNIPILPHDNCEYIFKNISIYNRWGAKVYESNNRLFRWTADKNPSGIYFYTIDLNKKRIHGWIEVIR